ncbi:hypothetical protein Bbelb_147770 [Branchiostoma belcheri]|nr:hypothetical protein Bbelb_147770 [Branchiostoma belcheri]
MPTLCQHRRTHTLRDSTAVTRFTQPTLPPASRPPSGMGISVLLNLIIATTCDEPTWPRIREGLGLNDQPETDGTRRNSPFYRCRGGQISIGSNSLKGPYMPEMHGEFPPEWVRGWREPEDLA